MSDEIYPAHRPLGPFVDGFQPPPSPAQVLAAAPWAELRRLAPEHAGQLHDLLAGQAALWDYMGQGPFAEGSDFADWVASVEGSVDPFFYAIIDSRDGAAKGFASYMRIDRASGVVEIGNIMLSPAIQRGPVGSAALMAMIDWAFGAGYRRVEWKCNALNAPSRRAALRLGFSFEGVFRQHMIVKGRNRDTAWFAMTDGDWQALKPAFAIWLAPDNFTSDGKQRARLSDLTRQALPGRHDG